MSTRTILALSVAAALANAVPISGQDDHPGRAPYMRACQPCHMAGAKGGGEAPGLIPYARELAELRSIVRQGMGLMPGLPPENVTDDEVERIHEYLRHLTAGAGASASRTRATTGAPRR